MTALVPSETACLANSPGKINRTDVWISLRRHGRLLVVSGQLGGFCRDLFEDVVDEGVHDAHRLGGDAGVRVHLLQDLVDVDLVGLDLLLGGRLGATFDGFLCWFLAGHVVC